MHPRSFSLLLLTSLLALAAACQREGGTSSRTGVARASLETRIEGPAGVSLLVPAGAVTEDTTLRIIVGAPARRPGEATTVSRSVRFEPEGKVFERPVEVTLPIEPSSLPAGRDLDDVVVMRAPRGSDAYVPLPTRRAGASSVAVVTEHFSDFVAVVFAEGDGAVRTGCGDGVCAGGETCSDCPLECGLCVGANLCGNGLCESNETRASCAYDCPCASPCPGPTDGSGQCTTPTTCGPGAYVVASPMDGCDRICASCGPGHYTDVANASGCTPCPIGTASPAIAASSASTCVACASGLEATSPGSALCTDIDECAVNGGGCAGGAATCVNNVGAPPTCHPIPPAGLSLWMDAGQNVFSDAGTTAATDGQPVQLWRDRSAAAIECLQAVANNRPTYAATVGALNGLPALHFTSGSNALLDCAAVHTVGTVFAVVLYDGPAPFVGYAGIFGHKNNGTIAILYGNPGTSTYGSETGVISADGYGNGTSNSPATTLGTPTILSTVLSTPVVYGNWIGRADGVGSTWSGFIAEIITYDTALSAAEVASIECYLATKYGLTLGHVCP